MEPKKKKSYYNCSVIGCYNSTLNSKSTFFKIPPDLNRKTEWLKLIDRQDLANSACLRARVCESHFNTDYISVSANRKLLKKNALPQLLLPEISNSGKKKAKKKVKVEKAEASTQCDSDFQQLTQQLHIPLYLLNDTDTPQKRRLLNEIQSHSNNDQVDTTDDTSSELDMFHNLCDKFLTKTLADIVKQQKIMKSFGHKYSMIYKIFCLKLYYVSPQAYQLLKGTLCLPSKPTLKKMYIPVTTKIDNNPLMGILRTKAQRVNDTNKNCSLVIGIIRIKTNLFYNIREDRIYGFHEVNGVQSPDPAKYALVAMVHGLSENYKHPVGFAFLAEPKIDPSVTEWIDKLIRKLFSIGLQVRVLVSDMRADFLSSAKNRSVSTENPYFMVGDKKIYYVFDPFHLIKLVRNNLMKYEFHFEDHVAKWDHIVQFYEKDKLKRYRLAPKLTESHIKPTNIEKTKMKYAKEVFSANVAASLSTYMDFGVIEHSVEGTIKLIEMMNNLYDIMNTSSLYGSSQFQIAFCGEEYQTCFVNKMLDFFASLEVINPSNGQNITSKMKFIEGFQITLKSLLLLFEDLEAEGYSHIFTNRLNQNCLENFFEQIKKNNGNSTKQPTSWQLVSGFKKIFFVNILKSPKTGSCAKDLAKCLLNCESLYAYSSLRREFDLKNGGYSKRNLMPPITTTDYNTLDLPEDDAIVYVSGYLLRTCLNSHDNCVQQLMEYSEDNSQDYSQDTTLTFILPGSFVEFITAMEETFCEFFEKNYLDGDILKSLVKEVKALTFDMPCKCFPLAYCKRLYMRMRIYQTLKYNNLVLKQCKNPQQLFSVVNLE